MIVENAIQNKNGIKVTSKCQCKCENHKKHCVCEEHCAFNPIICDCNVIRIVRSVNNWRITCAQKVLFDDLVVTCNVIMNTLETALINSNNSKTTYWLTAVVLLAIVCLLLLTVIPVQYYIKSELTIEAATVDVL